jgi:short-subunit dehydrogenase
MKIAITGHTAGIGKEFAEQLSQRGHSIVGISRREGENNQDRLDLFITKQDHLRKIRIEDYFNFDLK